MRYLQLFLSVLLFISCGEEKATEQSDSSDTATNSDTVSEIIVDSSNKNNSLVDSAGAFFIDTLIQDNDFDPLRMPDYTKGMKGLLVLTREYHGDEVDDKMRKANWFELYKNNDEYHLQPSEVKFETVFDPIVDEDSSEQTGVKVSGAHEDGIYLANLNGLKDGEVNQITLDSNVVLPGKSMVFDFNGMHYRFYASAYYQKREDKDEIKFIANYKMYLERDSAGVKTTQMIIANPIYDDLRDIRGFMFVGDIDNDGKPDFIMDTSNYYNGSTPTLFLSSYAEEGELVKAVAFHSSVGC